MGAVRTRPAGCGWHAGLRPSCGTTGPGRSWRVAEFGPARDAGVLTLLPIALTYRAGVHVHAGEFAAASALIEEAETISEATGNAPLSYTSLVLAAWRGQESPGAGTDCGRRPGCDRQG